jgi:hypothetical protein
MPLAGLTVAEAAAQHSPSPAAAAAAEPLSPTKSQLKKENQSLRRELAEAQEALRARETTPPGRGGGRRSHQQ